ncbi:MAG: hypothetical protein Q8L19_04355, partial [Reyranella sp.]|nr:hypothetical protein [Reyranella sp.]
MGLNEAGLNEAGLNETGRDPAGRAPHCWHEAGLVVFGDLETADLVAMDLVRTVGQAQRALM